MSISIVSSIVLWLALVGSATALVEPFDTIKEIAKKGFRHPDGSVIIYIARGNVGGIEVEFRFVYAYSDGSIALGGDAGDGEGYRVVFWAPRFGYGEAFLFGYVSLSEKEASELAFKILNRAVELGLVPK